MHIYFDLDGTLVDDTGQKLRPGIRSLLRRLTDEGHRLSLWTASTEERGQRILAQHGLAGFFELRVFRDDYDPEGVGHPKDIRHGDGDVLVDDDPTHTTFVQSIGKVGVLVGTFHTRAIRRWRSDSHEIYAKINASKEAT